MTQQTAATHTPGPWETSRDAVPSHHTQITVYAESSGERVATAFQSEANARLIAAAPAQNAALVKILESAGFTNGEAEPSLRELTVSIQVLRLARAAIALARSES